MYSIVTVTYNDCLNLKITIDSVRKYKNNTQKYYIIDGCSKDETEVIVNANKDIIDSFISEQDKGIYDAMNKVSKLPIGDDDYILWLNAGDELLPWDDLDMSQYHNDVLFAGVLKKSQRDIKQKGVVCYPKIYTPYNEQNFYPKTKYQHQGFMIKKSCFMKYMYDINIGLQAENLLMSKCIQNDDYALIMAPISIYYTDGVSNTKTKSVLLSYLKVGKELGFSQVKILWYQKLYFIKAIIYALLPTYVKNIYERKKYNNE